MINSELLNRQKRAGRSQPTKVVRQMFKFGLVGITNTLVDWGLYFLLTAAPFPVPLSPVVAKAAAYLGGTANSSFFNHRWTFRSARPVREILFPFFLANGIGTVINASALFAATQFWNISEPFALVLATVLAFAWNFSINKYVIFRPQTQLDLSGERHD